MKNLFVNIVIATVFFALGYVFYPSINDINDETAITNKATIENNNNSDEAIVENRNVLPTMEVKSNGSSDVEMSVSTAEAGAKLAEKSLDEKIPRILKEKLTDEEITLVKTELKEWSVAHKEQINELVTAHMSSENAEHMQLKISENNEFLTEAPIKQDPTEDDNWAYNMEQQLKMIISQHELSDKFELLNLSCKQLMCDIFGMEKEGNVWFKLYVSLLKNAPNVELPSDNNKPKSVVYMQNDVAVVYSQIRFKSS